jgi:hypothetical protein
MILTSVGAFSFGIVLGWVARFFHLKANGPCLTAAILIASIAAFGSHFTYVTSGPLIIVGIASGYLVHSYVKSRLENHTGNQR